MELQFLLLDDVVRIHADQLARYGGAGGVREQQLLESAVAQPRASFGGECLHKDIFEMAAAYAFHASWPQRFATNCLSSERMIPCTGRPRHLQASDEERA